MTQRKAAVTDCYFASFLSATKLETVEPDEIPLNRHT